MLTLAEWRMREMAGVSTIVTKKDCHNPDFQVQGAVCPNQASMPARRSKKVKKR